jgi:multidrug efflux pump subunit AcrB
MSGSRFNLSALAVRERSVTLFLIVLVTIAGIYAFFGRARGRSALHGEADDGDCRLAGATAQEIQDQVAEPLEKRLQELKWYDRTETYTRPGMAFITLSLQDKTPPSEVQEEFYQARKKLGDESQRLPAGVIGPMINDEFSDVTFALFALKAKRTAAAAGTRCRRPAPAASARPGVKKVNIIGEQAERIYIAFSHDRLATMGLSPQDIFNALNSQKR